MRAVMREFVQAAKEGPKMYFAPLVAAVRAVKAEVKSDAKVGTRVTSAPRSSGKALKTKA